MSRLDEIKARAEAATPGPWHAWDRGIGWEVHKGEERAPCGRSCDELNGEFRGTFTREDAAFIAAAREDLPWLVSEVERLTTEREWSEDRFPCDGGCVDAPEEACSRHGRTPEDLWRIIGEVAAERNALAAQVARVEALAEDWRYKGQFGWGPWQIGEGPDPEGYVMDHCASALRAALSGSGADTTDTQPTDQEVSDE